MEPKKIVPIDGGVFPAGTRLFAVGDTPVSWVPRVGGSFVSIAWDVMPPRAFSAAEALRKGRLIDPNEFEVMWAAMNFDRLSDPEQCAAVRRFLALPQVKREAMLPRPGAWPAPFTTLPTSPRIAPAVIFAGASDGGSDVLAVMTGNAGYSESGSAVLPGSVTASDLRLRNTLGFNSNDLVLLYDDTAGCVLQQVQSPFTGSTSQTLPFGGTYSGGEVDGVNLTSLGLGNTMYTIAIGNVVTENQPQFQYFGVGASNTLFSYDLLQLGTSDASLPMADGVVELRALYGVDTNDDGMGYTYGEPVVMKTKRWGWVAVFVSGFNNADGKGYFFVVNPRTGALLQKISTGAGSTTGDAGMAFVNAYVPDRTDGTGDAVYAGDLLGNLWRLDVTSPRFDYPAPTKITVLTDASGNAQPVTTRPLIEVQPNTNRRFVLVGSGRLLDTTDIASTMPQSYYAIRDGSNSKFSDSTTLPSGVTFPIGRSNLLANSDPVVGVTFNSPTQMGWYIDLGTGTGGIGWRVLTDSDAFYGVVAFASTLPGGDACSPSGQSRVYAIDFGTGKSVLTTSTTSSGTTTTNRIAYSSVLTNVVTDVKFFSVNGKARLIGGTDTGSLKSIPGIFGASTGLRRLNWRELPTAD